MLPSCCLVFARAKGFSEAVASDADEAPLAVNEVVYEDWQGILFFSWRMSPVVAIQALGFPADMRRNSGRWALG